MHLGPKLQEGGQHLMRQADRLRRRASGERHANFTARSSRLERAWHPRKALKKAEYLSQELFLSCRTARPTSGRAPVRSEREHRASSRGLSSS